MKTHFWSFCLAALVATSTVSARAGDRPAVGDGLFTPNLTGSVLDRGLTRAFPGPTEPSLPVLRIGSIANHVQGWRTETAADGGSSHFVVAFGRTMPVGTVLAYGRWRVSYLKPGGRPEADSDDAWTDVEYPGRSGHDLRVVPLPAGVTTGAVRFTGTQRADRAGRFSDQLWLATTFEARFLNVAPLADVFVSSSAPKDKGFRPDARRNDPVVLNDGSLHPGWTSGKREAPLSPASPEWIVLDWGAPRRLRGAAAFMEGSGFGEMQVQRLTGAGRPAGAGKLPASPTEGAGEGRPHGPKPAASDRSPEAPPEPPAAPPPVPAVGLTQAGEKSLPPRRLRGYGELGGEQVSFTTDSGGRASHLIITCESAGKARIVHAKYLSDLGLLGGVDDGTLRVGETPVPVRIVRDQGAVAAARAGEVVHVLAATDTAALTAVIGFSKVALRTGIEFEPTGTVPMLLDSWDRFGFRFYYRPWEHPKGKTWTTYNALEEFDYASACLKGHGRLGFVFWADANLCDTAEGMTNDVWWDWAARAAERRKLPVVMNIQIGLSTWLLNRYRDETMQKMPQYCGSFHSVAEPYHGGTGTLSWCAEGAKDVELSLLQGIVRRYAGRENVIDFLEPHGELKHGHYDVFLEYGPVADRSYRRYLKLTYGTPEALSRRWHGDAGRIRSWNDVRVPEVASFLGWGEDAVDLTGEWRLAYEEPPDGRKVNAPAEWFQPGFDDSSWPVAVAPGHDRTMFLPKRPAVYRRSFDAPRAWRRRHGKAWLYVWDLASTHEEKVLAFLNGTKVGEDLVQHARPHWMACEVTASLKAGRNSLALRLPRGVLAYRAYISPHPAKQYPDLGGHANARWVDFAEWRRWTRLEMARRGMEMIRQVDPDRGIVCMAPGAYAAGIKELCEDYGGRFHNTGYMGAWWAEYLPMLMRGSGLPFSLEPGGPARDLAEFRKMMGLYATEGINAIHYYIHVGSIIWDDEIRRHFEENLPVIGLIGKYHAPKAEAALLFSDRVENLTLYPWGKDRNTNLPSGYFSWKFNEYLLGEYQFDGLTDLDFGSGNADRYRVVIDTNTSVMDEELVGRLEAWVKRGGTFVTFIQTGRHTPLDPDAWPISRITGYEVTAIDPHDATGRATMRELTLAPGQDVLPAGAWPTCRANGLSLRKVAPECRDLLLWKDGAVAAGVRPLGKGHVVHLGAKFCHDRMWWDGTDRTKRIFRDLLAWAKVRSLPGRADRVLLRHYVSNNGLYDVWVMWNRDDKKPVTTDLVFGEALNPASCVEVKTGKQVELSRQQAGVRLSGLRFGPHETKAFLTPRGRIAAAPFSWFELQRSWWRGQKKPAGKRLPEVEPKYAMDLTEDWTYLPLSPSGEGGAGDVARFAAPDFDDSKWRRMRLGVWAAPEEIPSRYVVFRRRFTVPAHWREGEMRLWLRSWFANTLFGHMRVWLDGKEIKPLHPPREGISGMPVTKLVRAGAEHCLAVEVEGAGTLPGPRGNTWLSFVPEPESRLDLAGEWEPTRDALRYGKRIRLPGGWDALMARRKVVVARKHTPRRVYLHMDAGGGIIGALVNGRWIRRHHHVLGDVTHLNVTPWIRFGAENEIEIVRWGGPGSGEVREVALWFYDPRRYP